MNRPATVERHAWAISSGRVERANVAGIRRILNHAWRLRRGYSGNRSNATVEDADRLETLLERHHPTALGELHHSGLAVLRNKRYAKRWTPAQTRIIGSEHVRFDLVRFDDVGRGNYVPVWNVIAFAGGFHFRNISRQTAWSLGLESGPTVVEGNS